MSDRKILQPGPDHPITIEPTTGRVVVRVNGEVVADSRSALTLKESSYPAVYYIPHGDVAQHRLTRTNTTSWCPYKGDASYYSVAADGLTVDDAIWAYEHPHPAVSDIEGCVAFYPEKVDIAITVD